MNVLKSSKPNNPNQIAISDFDQFRHNFNPVRPSSSYNRLEILEQILHAPSFNYQPVEANPNVDLMHVIIPIYNNRKYLADLFTSLQNQTPEHDVHYIFVDDGSVDGSVVKLLELIANFKYSAAEISAKIKTYFTVLPLQHCGVSNARNLGLNAVLAFAFERQVEQGLFASRSNLFVANDTVTHKLQNLYDQALANNSITTTSNLDQILAQIQANPQISCCQLGEHEFTLTQPLMHKLVDFSYLASQWITFIDSDDWVSDNYVSGLTSYIESEQRQNLLVISNVLNYDHLSQKTEERFAGKMNLDPGQTHLPIVNLKNYGRVVCFSCFRLDIIALEQICFDEKISLGEDFIFHWLYVVCTHNHLPQATIRQNLDVTYYYRQGHSNTLSSQQDFSFNYVDSSTLAEKTELELAKANGKIINSYDQALAKFLGQDLVNVEYFTNFILYVTQQIKFEIPPIYLVYQVFSIVGRSFNNIFINLEQDDYFEFNLATDTFTVCDNLVPVLPYFGYLQLQSYFLSKYGVSAFFSFLGEDSIPLRVFLICDNYRLLAKEKLLFKAFTAIEQFKPQLEYYRSHKFNLMDVPFSCRLTTASIDAKFNHIYNLAFNCQNHLLAEHFKYCFELTSFSNAHFFKNSNVEVHKSNEVLPFVFASEIEQARDQILAKQNELNSFLRTYHQNLLQNTTVADLIKANQILAQAYKQSAATTNSSLDAKPANTTATESRTAGLDDKVSVIASTGSTASTTSNTSNTSTTSWCQQFLEKTDVTNTATDELTNLTAVPKLSLYQSNAYNRASILASYKLDPKVLELVYNPPKFVSSITPLELEHLMAEGIYDSNQTYQLNFNCYDQHNSFNPVGVVEIIPDAKTTAQSLSLALDNYLECFSQLFICYRSDLITDDLKQVISTYNQKPNVKSMAISPEFLENYLNYIPDDRTEFSQRLVGKISDRCKFLNIVLTQLNNPQNTNLSLAVFFNNNCYFNRKEFNSGLVRSLKYRNCFGFTLANSDISIDPTTEQVYVDDINFNAEQSQIFFFRIRSNWFFDLDNYDEQSVDEFNNLPFHKQQVKLCFRNDSNYLTACPYADLGFGGVYSLTDLAEVNTYSLPLLEQLENKLDLNDLTSLSNLNLNQEQLDWTNLSHKGELSSYMQHLSPQIIRSLHFYDQAIFANKQAVRSFIRAWSKARKH